MSDPTSRHGDRRDDDLDALLGAYALDAVDAEECRQVEDYLARNPRARAEVHEHREVASMLAWSGSTAPDGLWDRIASSIDEAPPAPRGELAEVLAMEPGRRRPRSRARSIAAWCGAAAAAAAIAVIAVNVGDDGGWSPQQAIQQQVEEAFDDPGSTHVTLRSDSSGAVVRAVIDREGRGYLVGDALPGLDAGRTYQLWGIGDGGEVVSLGLLGRRPATETFRADGRLTALAVTAERAGGVVVSQQPPVVAGNVS